MTFFFFFKDCALPPSLLFQSYSPQQMGLATFLPFFSLKVFNKSLKLWIFSKKSVIGLPDTINKCPVMFVFQIDNNCCSVTKSCPVLCNLMDCSTTGLPVPHHLLEFAPKFMSIESVMPFNHLILCCPLLLFVFNLSQHQGLFQWISSSPQVAKALEFQLQHQSFQWVLRVDFL